METGSSAATDQAEATIASEHKAQIKKFLRVAVRVGTAMIEAGMLELDFILYLSFIACQASFG